MKPKIELGMFICRLKSQFVYLIIAEQKQLENATTYTTISKNGTTAEFVLCEDDDIRSWFNIL